MTAAAKAKAAAKGKGDKPKGKPAAGDFRAEIRDIDPASIDTSPAEGVRHGDDGATAEEYAAADAATPGCLPAIDVFSGPTKTYLGDGSTRLAAWAINKRKTVPANVRTLKTDEAAHLEAIKFASKANAAHGRRRSDADKHAAVRQFLLTETWGELTDDEACTACNVHPQIVRDERAKLTKAGKLEGKASATRYRKQWDAEKNDWAPGYSPRGKASTPIDAAVPQTGKPAEPNPATTPTAPAPAKADEDTGDPRGLELLGELAPEVARALRVSGVTTVGRLAYLLNRPGTLPMLSKEDRADLSKRVRDLDAPAGPGAVAAVQRDAHGNPVPKQLARVFAACAEFDSFGQRFGRLLGEIKDAAENPDSPGTRLINANVVQQHMEPIKAEIYAARPECVCPECGPKIEADPKRYDGEKGCKLCAGRGWLARSMFQQLPPALKAKCEAKPKAEPTQAETKPASAETKPASAETKPGKGEPAKG